MKIGILTQPLHANYGGLLQNYALQQVLLRAGHEVETIDWTPSYKSLRYRLYRIKWTILIYHFIIMNDKEFTFFIFHNMYNITWIYI